MCRNYSKSLKYFAGGVFMLKILRVIKMMRHL